jgi:hypothetical protein
VILELPAQLLSRLYGVTLPLRRRIIRAQTWPIVHGFRLVIAQDDEFARRKLTDVLDFLAAEDPRALHSIQRQFEYLAVRRVKGAPSLISEPAMHVCIIDPRVLRGQHRDLVAARLVGRALEHRLQCRGLVNDRYGPRAAQLVMAATVTAAQRYPYSALELEARAAARRGQGSAADTHLPDA